MIFKCDQCGLCCQHLELFGEAYKDLDSGNGICKHYDPQSKLCKIYENRPLICNVEEGYKKIFHTQCSYEQYIKGTIAGCEKLKALFLDQK